MEVSVASDFKPTFAFSAIRHHSSPLVQTPFGFLEIIHFGRFLLQKLNVDSLAAIYGTSLTCRSGRPRERPRISSHIHSNALTICQRPTPERGRFQVLAWMSSELRNYD